MAPDHTTPTIESLLAQASWLDALARRLVADPHEADDIVQETWIAAIQHPPHRSVPVRSWLARVARNFALQRGRSESARKKREQHVAHDEAGSVDEEAVDRALAQQRLVDAVVALDEPYRSTVILHYFDHVTVADVAARQCIPESTVRTRLSRAIAQLRERFQRDGGDSWSSTFFVLGSTPRLFAPTPPAHGPAVSSTTLIGGLAVATVWKFGAAVAAAALVTWWMWPADRHVNLPALDARGPADSAPEALALGDHATADPRVALASVPATASANSSSPPLADIGARGALDVHVRWDDDGAPAPGVVVDLWQVGSPDPFTHWREGRTDALGSAHFDDVFAGRVQVEADRGGGDIVVVEAGNSAALEITIPNAIDVEGTVVDETGTPVIDARIWVSHYFNHTDGHEVERSDARGRYRLRDVGEAHYVAALHDGYVPTELHLLEPHPAGSRVELPLVLTHANTKLLGVVRDESGGPVPSARVTLTTQRQSYQDDTGRWRTWQFPPVHMTTDTSGAFEARDLGDGVVNVFVRADGFAPGTASAPSSTESRERLEVNLHPQAQVHGIVRNADGKPAAGVEVGYGDYAGPTSSQTWTHSDGSYRLTQLPALAAEIRVAGRELGNERRTIDLVPGADVEWNVTLHPNAAVRGRVVDDQGKPLQGWLVAAVNAGSTDRWKQSVYTGADGKFTLGNWPADADAVTVREPHTLIGEPAVVVPDVKPGGEDVLVMVKPDDRATSFISGRVLDVDGRPMPDTQVLWMSARTHMGKTVPTDDKGRFRVGPLRAGAYEIQVDVQGQATKEVHGIHLSPRQELDVGDVQFERSGTLVVHVHHPAGMSASANNAYITVRRIGSAEFPKGMMLKENDGRITGLPAGDYFLSMQTEGERVHAKVAIVADQTTSIDVTAEPATSRTVQFSLPSGTPASTLVHMRLLDASGEDVNGGEMEIPVSTPVWLGGLVVGTYSLEARIGEGPITHLALDVASLEPSTDVIDMRLR